MGPSEPSSGSNVIRDRGQDEPASGPALLAPATRLSRAGETRGDEVGETVGETVAELAAEVSAVRQKRPA